VICAIHLISVPLNQWCILTDLFQVLTTHVDRGQRNEAAAQQTPNFDDEEKWQIGKSNLDKWLQALLQKDGDSAGSSPANESPLLSVVSPVLSTARAATCENMDLEVGQDQVEFTLQHNQSESFKNLNISAFLKLGQVGKEKNQWFPEGTPWLLVPFLLFLCSVEIQLCEKIK
jgi:hypothetical protein